MTANEETRPAATNNRFSISLPDNRGPIEKSYNDGNGPTRRLIQEAVKEIQVNGKNDSLLIAEVSAEGIIDIINERTGRIVPWNYLTGAERWSFWQHFNRLLDAIMVTEE